MNMWASRALTKQLAISAVLAVSLIAGGCVTSSPYKKLVVPPALRISKSQFYKTVRTVCLAEIESELGLEADDVRHVKMERLIAVGLIALGLDIRKSKAVTEIWDETAQSMGGFYDANTGDTVAERYDAIRASFFVAIKERLQCDALVTPNLVVVDAAVWNFGARWDGQYTNLGYAWSGNLPAVSLRLAIHTGPDDEAYFGVGGIQLLQEIKSDKITDPHFEAVKSKDYIANKEANQKAVAYALKALQPDEAKEATGTKKANKKAK